MALTSQAAVATRVRKSIARPRHQALVQAPHLAKDPRKEERQLKAVLQVQAYRSPLTQGAPAQPPLTRTTSPTNPTHRRTQPGAHPSPATPTHAAPTRATTPPPPARSPSRASTFGLTPFLNTFKHDIERSFLTPLEKEVYALLTQVTGRGRLVPASSPAFAARLVLPDRDSAEALASVQHLTREFPDYQKELLCRDLRNFLTGDQRRVLRVVLFRGVEVFCEGDEEGTVGREGRPVLRASPAREVVVVEGGRAGSNQGGYGNHRFSRGSG
ncbi:hypothetical protein LTR29_006769 [Friedmanniomyces endolithicus]|nr:hypothetical protein LTR29_006769 [Friedmanniomyces endolithicus]